MQIKTLTILFNQLWLTRLIVTDLNPDELSCYPFMVSLDKCDGSCIYLDDISAITFDLSAKLWALKRTKNVNVEVFNMISSWMKWKQLIKVISCDCKCRLAVKNAL